MELSQFLKLKKGFRAADTDGKINIIATTEGLTQTQYNELFSLFPLNELDRLEAALA